MTKRTRTALLVTVVALMGAGGFYVFQQEDSFRVEFGEPEMREAFAALLTKHNITYHVQTDHLGRVWVVPDPTKRKEYEAVAEIWEKGHEEKVRRENEARKL